MAVESASKDLAAIVAEAEAAVAAVKDADLRRVAFDKILTTLLDAGTPAATRPTKKRPPRGESQRLGHRVKAGAPERSRLLASK